MILIYSYIFKFLYEHDWEIQVFTNFFHKAKWDKKTSEKIKRFQTTSLNTKRIPTILTFW